MSRAPFRLQYKKPRSGCRGNTLVGIFVGLVLGALVAAAIALYFTASSPFQKPSGKSDERSVTPPRPAAPEPIALPGKAGDKPVEKPHFDFYNVLPKGSDTLPAPKPEESSEVVKPPEAVKPAEAVKPPKADKPAAVSDSERAARILKGETADKPKPEAAAAPADKPAVPEKYYLQAGSFEDPSEADNLKARLALMGVEASVQKVDLPDKGTVHRVRAGPYLGQDEMGKARAQLASSGINVAIIRIKPKEPKPAVPPQ
jgi:cell division protein FtsN